MNEWLWYMLKVIALLAAWVAALWVYWIVVCHGDGKGKRYDDEY